MLESAGYAPVYARQLHDEGMGPEELRGRLAIRPGPDRLHPAVGSLGYTHAIFPHHIFDPDSPQYRGNTHHTLQGGLHDDDETLQQLVEMAAESMEIENWKDASVTDEVTDVARDFDFAVASALDSLVVEVPPKGGASADDLWYANGPFLILMTLRGEGVGIWDGTWDAFYDDRTIRDRVQPLLEEKLGEYADVSGGGRFEEALMNAAYETTGGDFEENTRGSVNPHAAEDLELYIDNDRRFSPMSPDGMGHDVALNMHRKLNRGTYDPEKAVVGWLHVVDAAAKAYAREFGGDPWHIMFSAPTRRYAAAQIAKHFEREHEAGEHEHLD